MDLGNRPPTSIRNDRISSAFTEISSAGRSANFPTRRVGQVDRTSQAQTPVSLGPGNSIVKPAGHPFWAIPYHVGNPILDPNEAVRASMNRSNYTGPCEARISSHPARTQGVPSARQRAHAGPCLPHPDGRSGNPCLRLSSRRLAGAGGFSARVRGRRRAGGPLHVYRD